MRRPASKEDVHTATVRHWQQCVRQGNAQLDRGELAQAVASYERACARAQHHAGRWPNAGRATAALVVSSLNLAEALVGADRIEDAASTLCAIHAQLVLAAGDTGLVPVQRRSALRHMRETTALLMRFQALHRARADVREALLQGCQVLARWTHAAACAPAPRTLQ